MKIKMGGLTRIWDGLETLFLTGIDLGLNIPEAV